MLVLLALFACTKDDVQDSEVEDTQVEVVPDADGDGFESIEAGGEDCDDSEASVYPGAAEVCDQIDQDCDGDLVEEFENLDGDAFADCDDPDPCVAPSTALVSWYPGDNMTDIMGGVALDQGVSSVPGLVGRAWDLRETEEGLYNYNSDAWLTSDSWSTEMWIQTESQEEAYLVLHAACFGKCVGGENAGSVVGLTLNADGAPMLLARDADAGVENQADMLTGTVAINDGQWHHLAGVVDSASGTLSLYVDGVAAGSMSTVHNDLDGFGNIPGYVEPFFIGNSAEGDGYLTLIDEFSIYTGALSADDVAGIYGAGLAGKCAP